MSIPKISIVNFSTHLDDREVQRVIRSINRQVVEDFIPVWGAGRELKLHASAFDPKNNPAPEDVLKEDFARGSAVIYLVDESTLPGALGYHALNNNGVPYGFVFTDFIEDWTITLSHEVLELIIDPGANVFVPGPDPRDPTGGNFVLHTYEVCDAVERSSYKIDDVPVSNFITPAYFTVGDELGTRNDFLGVGVTSFGAIPGSHLAFLDLATGFQTFIQSNSRPNQLAMLDSRLDICSSDKQKRPGDELLDGLLEKQQGRYKLQDVTAITRSSRYRQVAKNLGIMTPG